MSRSSLTEAPPGGDARPTDAGVLTTAFARLVQLLDLTEVALVVFDRAARPLWLTAGVHVLVAEDREAEDVLAAACALARSCAQPTLEPAADLLPTGGNVPRGRETATRHWSYRLLGIALSVGRSNDAASAVVIERATRAALTDDALRDGFGLSAREAEVARLVAAGRATPAVAASLGISSHTARHHLEHVFTKLGVNTRAELQALVRGTGASAPRDSSRV